MFAVNFLLLGAVLFCIGVFGVIARRNAVMVLMSVELILNAVNAIKVSEVLRGTSERISMQWLYSVESHLLGVIERSQRHPSTPETRKQIAAA